MALRELVWKIKHIFPTWKPRGIEGTCLKNPTAKVLKGYTGSSDPKQEKKLISKKKILTKKSESWNVETHAFSTYRNGVFAPMS